MKAAEIILQPVVSEKSFASSDKGTYMFRVLKTATKKEIENEIERRFKVKVAEVRTLSLRGKKVNDWQHRKSSYRQDFKKAVVTLKSGTIDIFK